MLDLDEIDDNGHQNEEVFKFQKILEYTDDEVKG